MKLVPVVVVSLALLRLPANGGGIGKGQNLFERRCSGCHRLDEIRSGPRLRGVFGRAAGADSGFPYSEALKTSRLVWNESTLDRWLANPDTLVPDNEMAFRLSRVDERAQIIAYLKSVPPR